MSQQTTTVGSTTVDRVADIFESISSYFITREQIRAGMPIGYSGSANTADAYPRPVTGVNSDGTTLVPGQLIAGVNNSSLLAGVGVLAAVGLIAYALTR